MQGYAKLLDELYYAYSHLEKIELLKHYFQSTPDPDRGYAIGLIDNQFSFKHITRNFIKLLMYQKMDPLLYDLSYDYVGDSAETIAHLWTSDTLPSSDPLPALHIIVENLSNSNKKYTQDYFVNLLNHATVIERWALLKLAFHNLRIGVSSRFLKQTLASYGHKTLEEIEDVWHSLIPPYESLFAWLENRGEKPMAQQHFPFTPVMLCQPLKEKELTLIQPDDYLAEYKYDGIRIQIVSREKTVVFYSRKGENITAAFPDLADFFLTHIKNNITLDGELLIKSEKGFESFQHLQQRINRKTPSKKLIATLPAHVILFDVLFSEDKNLRAMPFIQRRAYLEAWIKKYPFPLLSLSPLKTFKTPEDLGLLRDASRHVSSSILEGLVFKRKDSLYVSGRPVGQWYKWKRDPFLIDAVLMYAQRGHGKRSSFYSDYTFGVWKENNLVPIGKAYSGFTDEELKKLDNWIRKHIIKKFGPVAEVEKQMVFEVAFENISISSRHKAGYALRFPRIHRIRWDKPAEEAERLETLANILENKNSRGKQPLS